MSEQTLKVFVVDGDPVSRVLNAFLLQAPGVEIREFGEGDACLAAIGERPDIIVLDVAMPGTDGVSICRILRLSGQTDAEIIFVAGRDDPATRAAAHDAGGTDYIVKPYAVEHLIERVEVAKRAIWARREVAEHVQAARRATAAPMPAPGSMGVLIAFLHNAARCRTADELGLTLCHALDQYCLHGLINLHHAREYHCYSSQGRLPALEAALRDDVHGIDRIFRFHDRLAIEDPHTALLIPNLPPVDHEQAIRLRRHLTMLVSGAEMRYAAMLSEGRQPERAACPPFLTHSAATA